MKTNTKLHNLFLIQSLISNENDIYISKILQNAQILIEMYKMEDEIKNTIAERSQLRWLQYSNMRWILCDLFVNDFYIVTHQSRDCSAIVCKPSTLGCQTQRAELSDWARWLSESSALSFVTEHAQFPECPATIGNRCPTISRLLRNAVSAVAVRLYFTIQKHSKRLG